MEGAELVVGVEESWAPQHCHYYHVKSLVLLLVKTEGWEDWGGGGDGDIKEEEEEEEEEDDDDDGDIWYVLYRGIKSA